MGHYISLTHEWRSMGAPIHSCSLKVPSEAPQISSVMSRANNLPYWEALAAESVPTARYLSCACVLSFRGM